MSEIKAKTINLLLYTGKLDGVISIEDSGWNSGELYSSPRDSVADLLNTDACNKYGVYLLLDTGRVYIGQSSDFAKRITYYTNEKKWWKSVVILTTKDDSMSQTDIDYLETFLIEKASSMRFVECDNRKKDIKPKVDKYRKFFLKQYMEEALFLMQFIGISIFSQHNSNQSVVNVSDLKAKLTYGKRAKHEALKYLKENGISVDLKATYAVLGDNGEFWANPQVKYLNHDWNIILNDNKNKELLVLRVPADTFSTTGNNELYVRSDKQYQLDLNLNCKTLVDRKSGKSFKKFIVNKLKY